MSTYLICVIDNFPTFHWKLRAKLAGQGADCSLSGNLLYWAGVGPKRVVRHLFLHNLSF